MVLPAYTLRQANLHEKQTIKCILNPARVSRIHTIHWFFFDDSQLNQNNLEDPQTLVVYHYSVKSLQDWTERVKRGVVQGYVVWQNRNYSYHSMQEFYDIEAKTNAVEDKNLVKFVPQIEDKLVRRYDLDDSFDSIDLAVVIFSPLVEILPACRNQIYALITHPFPSQNIHHVLSFYHPKTKKSNNQIVCKFIFMVFFMPLFMS